MRNVFLSILAVTIWLATGVACAGSQLPSALASANGPATKAAIVATMDEAVTSYRKVIVLMDGASDLDEGNRERVRNAAWILFEQNHTRLEGLEESLTADAARKEPSLVEAFLDRLEHSGNLRDADKLAFRDIVDGLAALTATEAPNPALRRRIREDAASLNRIQSLYQSEVAQIFSDMQARGLAVHREAWRHYVDFLQTKFTREAILREMDAELPVAESRGGAAERSKLEITGLELPEKTVALTFDDGPHPRYTDQVLAILKKYGLHGVFFEIGQNVGSDDEQSQVKLRPTAAVSNRILESGSTIGNHTYTHPVLPKLAPEQLQKEIDYTSAILTDVLKTPPILFRPPYGAVNTNVLTEVQSQKMKTVIWNVDSEDWADPVPNSVAQRVLSEVEKQKRGIILFHDIHKVVTEALPTVIETLKAQGYSFVSWNGSSFGPAEMRGEQVDDATPPAPTQPYRESWAAIIGIDDYQNWQKLQYAVHDAQGVRDLLIQKYGFKPDHVFSLFDGQATRQNILTLLGDKLGSTSTVQKEDRVFVFFAGHGATRSLASGRDLGYIIPADADLTDLEGTAISMTNFQDISEAVPAKHLFFVMDSCYSGLALTRGGGQLPSQNYLNEIARREARQMFTAGGADQQVADNGPNGHSFFTWTLLQGLDGRADLNGDGVITATELAAYVTPAVSELSRQTPAFGNLPGSEGGDFIFSLKHDTEFLNGDSVQLGDDAIKVNTELEKLRDQMRAEEQKNEELRKQLAAAQAQLQQNAQGTPPAQDGASQIVLGASTAVGLAAPVANSSTAPNTTSRATASAAVKPVAAKPSAETAAAANDEGIRLYKEKQYADAAAKFVAASALKPNVAQYANNAGFAYFRMGQYDDAVKWLLQAIALDPKRAVAYLNLGDGYMALSKKTEAMSAYQKYLDLAPNGSSAAYAREKLQSPPGP